MVVRLALDEGAVTAAFTADGGGLLIGLERAAGTEPAVLGILRHTGQLRVARARLQGFGNGSRQHTRLGQAHPLIPAQINPAAVQERAVLLSLDAGNRRIADKDRIVSAEEIAGLGVEVFIIEIIFTQHLAGGVLAFEVDDQACQRLGADILEGQADGDLSGNVPLSSSTRTN